MWWLGIWLIANRAADVEERPPANSQHFNDKGEGEIQSSTSKQGGGNRNADEASSQKAGYGQQRVEQSAGTQHRPSKEKHGFNYFIKGMELALKRPGASKVVHPRVYSALIQRGKETRR